MEKINIEAILLKRLNTKMHPDTDWETLDEAWSAFWHFYDPPPAKREIIAAIKEIGEKLLDLAAENAKTLYKYDPSTGNSERPVNKESILKLKKLLE